MVDATIQIEKFKEFLDLHYKRKINEIINEGKKSLVVDFFELSKFDVELSDELLENPEDTIKASEIALSQLDVPEDTLKRVRFFNLPSNQEIVIRDIRANHLNQFLLVRGIVRQASDVRPQVTLAKFECPSCGNTITIPQLDSRFKEPSRCSCGRRGKFRLLSKELVDVQRLVIEEIPETLEGGEQPKRISVFLSEDLVEPRMEKRTTPGSKVKVSGIVKEVPLISRTGAQSTRYDLAIECNFIEPIDEIFEEIDISDEDRLEIKRLASDEMAFENLRDSIAPTIYGHDLIKDALVLQMFGGVRKINADGTRNRGDMHILLVGDPGCIAGSSQVALYYNGMEQIQNLGKEHLQPIKEVVTKIRKNYKEKGYDFATLFHIYKNQPVLKVVTETGKELVCTYNQPFLTKEGWKRADNLILYEKIRVMPKIPNNVNKLAFTGFLKIENKFGYLEEVCIPEYFTEELASLCGYVIGDGNIHSNGSRLTNYVNSEEIDLIPQLTKLWLTTFNISPLIFKTQVNGSIKTIHDGRGNLSQVISKKELYIMEINSKQVAQSLSFLSIKRVPKQIFSSPIKIIARFISWLFEADGCAFNNGHGRTSIQLKSREIDLLKDVQLLLLYFGIQSRIIEHNLCIRRSFDIDLFAKYIGFNSAKKKETLGRVLLVVREKNNVQKRKGYQRYEKIVSVTGHGVMDVYDFEVPVSHMFIANGILCHNSGKSQTLQFISKAAPKARFISGRGASLDYNEDLLIRKDSKIEIINIGEFVDENCLGFDETFIKTKDYLEALSLNIETKKLEWKPITSVYRHKIHEKLRRFTFESGRQITVTKDHSIYILENGITKTKNAGELKVSDFVLIPKKIPIIENNRFDPEIARFLGYFIAEGQLVNRDGSYKIEFTLHKKEFEVIEDIKSISKKYFKKEAKICRHGENSFRLTIYGRKSYIILVQLLGEVAHKKAKEKRIPRSILNSSAECRKQFIYGYIKCDYGVTKSKRLMSDLLFLFLQDSIIASCNIIDDTKITYFDGRSIKSRGYRYDLKSPKFYRSYKAMYSKPPISKVGELINEYFFKSAIKHGYSKVYSYKYGDDRLLNRLSYIKNKGISSGVELRSLFGEAVLEYFGDNTELFIKSKQGGVRMVYLTEQGSKLCKELEDLRLLMDSDLGFVKIRKIEEVSSSSPYVYDISVLDNENFVGGFGGIICHNTGAGITATVVKDEFLRGWALEAGAVVLANKGIAVIDELDKMSPEDRSALHEAMEQQCMLPEFRLMLSDGSSQSIGKMVDTLISNNREKVIQGKDCEILEVDSIELLSTDFYSHFPIRASRVSRHIAPETFVKFELENGREITVTPEHPCWSIRNGKIVTVPAETLRKGDYFPVPSVINTIETKYTRKKDYLSKILGYYISNKCHFSKAIKENSVLFSMNDESLAKDFSYSVRQYFGKGNLINASGSRILAGHTINELINFMEELDTCEVDNPRLKKIPEIIMSLPKENVKTFLQSMFDSIGIIAIKRNSGLVITLAHESKILVDQLSDLLLRFGIQSKINNNNVSGLYCLHLAGEFNIIAFCKNIGSTLSQKNQILSSYFRNLNTIKSSVYLKGNYSYVIDKNIELGYVLEPDELEVMSNGLLQLRPTTNKTFLTNEPGSNSIEHPLYEFKSVRPSYARWVKVKQITRIKNKDVKWVYDVTIEPHHTFIANGMVLHNTVTISKANIHATLRAETTILAAANPKLGRFDPYTSIAAQIDLPPTLINRFDLIFPVKDIPNKDMDEKIAKHVLTVHQSPNLIFPKIPTALLKKYVSYARQSFHPILTDAAVREIIKFYVGLRSEGSSEEGGIKRIPITARQLEALIRMSEASARVRLSDKVGKKDAQKAIKLLEHCLTEVGMDRETGKIDIDKISTGITTTTRSRIHILKETIDELESRLGKSIPLDELAAEAIKRGIDEGKLDELIENLKRAGDIFEPKRGFIQKI